VGRERWSPRSAVPGGFCVAVGRRYYLALVLWYQVVARSLVPRSQRKMSLLALVAELILCYNRGRLGGRFVWEQQQVHSVAGEQDRACRKW